MNFIRQIEFDAFRLDMANAQLWQGSQQLTLRPQSLAVLKFLLEHSGHLVTRAELLHKVWQGRYVSDATIRGCIREIRMVLQDSAKTPQYIETVGRRGYRFIDDQRTPAVDMARVPSESEGLPIVGRDYHLKQLGQKLALAESGQRQLTLIGGEAGVGKTSLAGLFIQETGATAEFLIGRGRCIDQYGRDEAYLPVLDILYDLAQSDQRDFVISAMRSHAPSWLVQLTTLIGQPEREQLRQQLAGITQMRMLQELNQLLIILAQRRPLLLLIEDLHWCDTSTLELLAYLAQRKEPACWLLLGTYRPAEVQLHKHRLRDLSAELRSRECCSQLTLAPLGSSDIRNYLHSRLGATVNDEVITWLLHRTGGNALFLTNIVTYLLQQKLLICDDAGWKLQATPEKLYAVPEKLQQFIFKQLEQLPEAAQNLLEVASVAGETFTTAAIAAGLQFEVRQVERLCEDLARLGSPISEVDLHIWPDATPSARYRFQHTLYRQVLYERLGQARRARLHRDLGERLESGYGERVAEIAGELALHFSEAREYTQAVRYYQLAATTASHRGALHEALNHSLPCRSADHRHTDGDAPDRPE
jgi:predicted ATPase/DNA-binding winged helix-turn-helix (wHTH) protein